MRAQARAGAVERDAWTAGRDGFVVDSVVGGGRSDRGVTWNTIGPRRVQGKVDNSRACGPTGGRTMVITCPECSAKYKLPGQKIRGRGAKITCPRCSHVFVIFSKDLRSDDGVEVDGEVEPQPARRRTMPGPAVPKTPTEAPPSPGLPGGLRAEDIFGTGDDLAVADGEPSDAGAPAGTSPGGMPAVTPPGGRPASVAEPPSGPGSLFGDERPRSRDSQDEPSEGALDAEKLDFAGVGITTWKVKVSIGLVYDFSDIKTLRKYMQEGKITQDDQVSYDGKEWHRIGAPAEFEAFLIELYRQKRAAGGAPRSAVDEADQVAAAASDSAAARPGDPIAPSSSLSSLEETAAPNGLAVDLKRKPRKRRRKPGPQQEEPTKILGMSVPVFVVVLVLVVGGLGFGGFSLATSNRAGGGGGVADTGDTDQAELERIRQEARDRIDEKLEKQREEIVSEENGDAAGDAATPTPVPPDNDGRAVPVDDGRPEVTPPPVEDRLPERVTPDDEPDTTPPPVEQPTEAPTEAGDTIVEETTAEDWFLLGDAQLSAGNCGGAIAPLQQAVSKAPGNTTYNYKLGLAHHRCGNDSAALGPLKVAAATYPDAQQLVEEIEGGGG